MDSWKKAVSAVRRRVITSGLTFAVMLSTDGFANSYKNEDEFIKTCLDYFVMIKEHGANTVNANLKEWLNETSEMGCGDDITLLIAYYLDNDSTNMSFNVLLPDIMNKTQTESEAILNEQRIE